MTIGEFARATGISASALRYYHDCGLVIPGEVDPITGYRHYHHEQIVQVLLLRHLRAAGLPLAHVRRLLHAPPAAVHDALQERLTAMEHALQEARAGATAAMDLLASTRPGPVTVSGDELAAAVRRVCRSADHAPDLPPDLAVLAGVLMEVHGAELTLVATDRYRLIVQALPLHPTSGSGDTAHAVVPATTLERLHPWLRRQNAIRLDFGAAPGSHRTPPHQGTARLTLVADGAHQEVDTITAGYPDHRRLLDDLPAPATRILAPRRALLAATEAVHAGSGPLCWDADPRHGLRLTRPGHDGQPVIVDAEVHGPRVRLGFDRTRLHAVLTDSIGPDLGLEITRPDQPVVIRCADRTGITTLLMPTALPPTPPARRTSHAQGAA